jgi:hypothetical protein
MDFNGFQRISMDFNFTCFNIRMYIGWVLTAKPIAAGQ